MFFNSLHFAVFLFLVFMAFWSVASHQRIRNLLLLAASYYFYMSWDWRYAGLIAGSTILDYLVGRGLERTDRSATRKGLLTLSLVGNLGTLATFKYFNFFSESMVALLSNFGLSLPPFTLHLLLPVGISFYTFQTLSYTIDVYRKDLPATRNFIEFAVFVSFFPQLVAGPIVRASHFLPQMRTAFAYDDDRTRQGLARIFRGLFKKIVIADTLAVAIVDPVFANPETFSGLTNLLATYGYAMQIYCDFSGYSDVAIGAAAMLGFELPMNFNRPYQATSVQDFWSRWHVSLSTWLRDYLYIPLGGNRKGRWKTYRNLALTMLLGGLWHGAAWNFVAWGAFHGIWLIVSRLYRRNRQMNERKGLRRWLQAAVTFQLVCCGWILFRANSMDAIAGVFGQILTWSAGETILNRFVILPLLMGFGIHLLPKDWMRRAEERFAGLPAAAQAVPYFLLLVLFTAMSGAHVPFIYFQF